MPVQKKTQNQYLRHRHDPFYHLLLWIFIPSLLLSTLVTLHNTNVLHARITTTFSLTRIRSFQMHINVMIFLPRAWVPSPTLALFLLDMTFVNGRS